MIEENEKEIWVVNYLSNSPEEEVNILSCTFVGAYCDKFKPKTIKNRMWGADYIPELSKLLRKMWSKNLLSRTTYGIPRDVQGFPSWVFVYTLKTSQNLNTPPTP